MLAIIARVGRIAFEQDKLRPDRLDLLGGFRQKIFEQFVHGDPDAQKRTRNSSTMLVRG
jgi:hypothetical protein